jgi:hypothetical protein
MLPKLDRTDVKIVLGDLYETEIGIYNHFGQSNKTRPLASVAFHNIEDVNDGSGLQLAMRVYIDTNIREHFGLSFEEYLAVPRDVHEMMNQIALDQIKKKSSAMADIEKDLKS